MRAVIAIITAAAITPGCAMSGPMGSEVLSAKMAPQKSRVVIYRSSAMGFAVQPDYALNGKAVAASQPNGFIVCNVEPGVHELSVGNIALNVNFGGGSDKAKVNLRPGQTAYFKAEPQPGLTIGVITLSEVTENQGLSDTVSLHKIESSCV
ncbi:MAG: DUF2846 domain-containing protein [Hyphomicrobiales bacterium]|nr:DUF2846 domain-containing protein [Hyphomicrobiales bacterium]